MEQLDDIENSKLYKAIYLLCNKVIEKTLIYKDAGNLNRIPYQKVPVKDINYDMESVYYDWNDIKYFDLYKWQGKDMSDFINSELLTLTECDEVIKELTFKADIAEQGKKLLALSPFFNYLISRIPNGFEPEDIRRCIRVFISDYNTALSDAYLTWNVELWLVNIRLESEEIQLSDKVFLRRPQKSQLERSEPRNDKVDDFIKMTGKTLPSLAILSYTIEAPKRQPIGLYSEEIINETELWLNILRLFKPGSVNIIFQKVTPVSIIEHSFAEHIETPYEKAWKGKVDENNTSSYKYPLLKVEENLLKSFVVKMRPVLKELSHKAYLAGTSEELAFHRYNDALLKSEVDAYRILSSMTSFEAMLSDGNTEITYKIKLRIAGILRFFKFDTIDVCKKISEAYNLRSKLVHGVNTGEKKKDLLLFSQNHTHEIINYNRICIIVMLQFKGTLNKDSLIKLLDHSFINDEKLNELEKLMKENIVLPIIDPYKKSELAS